MRILLYCPDRHITYTGATPETAGVGGGITARIHLARALARRGHEATVLSNTPGDETVDGARFVALDSHEPFDVDVLVAMSSGGDLDLAPLADVSGETSKRIAWVHGVTRVRNIERFAWDGIVVPSRFVAGEVSGWGLGAEIWPIPNGFQRYPVSPVDRDPRLLVYTSHPSKGLDAALGVLDGLRRRDEHWHLRLYGGAGLWGQHSDPVERPGVEDRGMVSQPELAAALREAAFALHLQAIPEAYSISVSEAMAAGAIVVASPAGALAERIVHRKNGLLIPGPHDGATTIDRAVREILGLSQRRMRRIRARASSEVLDWDAVAELWERYLER